MPSPTEPALRLRFEALGLDEETLRQPPGASLTPTRRSVPAESIAEALGPQLELGEVIGEGGMGVVRLARQTALRRSVAVKTLKTSDPRHNGELLREARVTGALEHPNIVPVYALTGGDDEAPLLVMKRVEGRSWREEIRHDLPADVPGRMARLDSHLDVLMHVCHAVHFAHSRGVVHRDLKPDNVMIGGFGEVYVLDWGVAVAFREDADPVFPRPKELPGIVGTPCCMAPEMALDEPARFSARTDVYLLGAMLHELITGTKRHEGDVMQCLYKACMSEPVDYGADVPRELAAICQRATKRDPEERYATADELRVALVEYRRHDASRTLAREALRRLDEATRLVHEGEAPRQVHRVLGEVRFGLEQALSTWPENLEAHDGLQAVTQLVCEHELAAGDAKAARRALSQLVKPHPALSAKVEALEEHARQEQARVEAMAAREKERDLRGSRMARVLTSAVLATVWAVLPFLVAWFQKNTTWKLTDLEHLRSSVLFALSVVVPVWFARDVLFQNRASRNVVATLSISVAFNALLRLVGYTAGIPLALTMPIELLGYGIISLLVAVWMDRVFVVAGIAYVAAAFACALLPDYAFEVVGTGNFVAMGASALVLARRARMGRQVVSSVEPSAGV